jgi:hypothetical protein
VRNVSLGVFSVAGVSIVRDDIVSLTPEYVRWKRPKPRLEDDKSLGLSAQVL